MGDPDEALVRDSQRGDPAAFESLVRRHQQMIHALLWRMTGSVEDAQDLAQETFLRAWEQLPGFQGRAKFSTWLCRIAVNACLNWREREARRHNAYGRYAQEAACEADPGDGAHPDGGLAGRVHAALLKLPAKQRAAIVLTVYEGLNHAEAARVLGCSETTVSWRLFTARRKLKRWLARPDSLP
ncbi:MAG: RNA polymerase sigma factor [Verrucomicrobiae bacterium]|nr:RNA polymerase sigma factor [Verrucomicrobiae bacterium]MDW8308904.1 RNA polymerase sigma factor [Verrucomicrobiales bacterium]